MRRIGWTLLASLFGVFLIAASDAERTLHFPLHEFSLAPLEAPRGSTNAVLLTMSLPAATGFSPNVNVQAQNSPGTMDDYIVSTKMDCDSAGLKIIKLTKVDDNPLVFEYAGALSGQKLHWYSKASRKGDEILLVTATATEDQWAKVGDQLQQCVDSFQRDADK